MRESTLILHRVGLGRALTPVAQLRSDRVLPAKGEAASRNGGCTRPHAVATTRTDVASHTLLERGTTAEFQQLSLINI